MIEGGSEFLSIHTASHVVRDMVARFGTEVVRAKQPRGHDKALPAIYNIKRMCKVNHRRPYVIISHMWLNSDDIASLNSCLKCLITYPISRKIMTIKRSRTCHDLNLAVILQFKVVMLDSSAL